MFRVKGEKVGMLEELESRKLESRGDSGIARYI